ncbi:hypothetical protein HpMMM46_06370 [Helicobacter pylori]
MPSIALLSQTFREYSQEKSEPFYASIVCSDDKVGKGKKSKSDDDADDINFSELPLKPSTRLEDILSVHEKAQKENKRFIIFSTYQSALRIQEAQRMGLGGIDLIICDEAHRTVGAMYSSNERDDKNAFTLCHSDEHIKRVTEKYGQNSSSRAGGNTTRDTLIQSIYLASELLEDKGVIGFVVNGSFIDSKSADGFRKCVAQDFSHLYVLNLRGNARTSGETSKKEGGGIFGSGSRATIAVIFFVKDTSVKNSAIHYYDIGDYLKREEKLNRLANFTDLDAINFETIIPNNKGDWINQRGDAFDKLIPLKRDKTLQNPSVFDINSTGVASGRDPWVYNFSPNILTQSVQKCIDTYNADLKRFNECFREAFKQRTKGVKSGDLYKQLNDKEITTDKTKIAWTDGLKNKLIKNKNLQESRKESVRLALYRPFNKQWLYWDKDLIHRQGKFSKIFPNKHAQNVVINTGAGNGKDFSALVSDFISDSGLISPNQAYPLYCYDDLGRRDYAISGLGAQPVQEAL